MLKPQRNVLKSSKLKQDSKFISISGNVVVSRLKVDESVDLYEVVKSIPENFTGADFGALTTETYMLAVKERI